MRLDGDGRKKLASAIDMPLPAQAFSFRAHGTVADDAACTTRELRSQFLRFSPTFARSASERSTKPQAHPQAR